MSDRDLLEVCRKVVARARKAGATQAEAYAERTREASVRVRDGEIEDLVEATGKGLGLRVIRDGRLGFAYTSDFSEDALADFVKRALALARVSERDPANRLPDAKALEKRNPELHGLFDPEVEALTAQWKIDAARLIEKAARAEDRRISGFEAVGAGDHLEEVAIASSEGLEDRHRGSYVFLYAMPVAKTDDGQLQTSYWVDYKRRVRDLETPEEVGRTAARRAARMLGARKAKTQRVPVVMEPSMAASFVAGLAGAVNGDQVQKRASFLGERLGERIAPDTVNVVDDGLLAAGLATAPFDGEGVATRRNSIIEAGQLRCFLYDTFTARKARTRTTGNAHRGYSTLPSIGTSNLYLQAGSFPASKMLEGIRSGFYVTSMLGRGANTVTGDYSRGANGLWIRDGELAEAVQEVTVSGNLLDMLQAIDAVGDDLDFLGAVGAPTIRFAELTVSGS
jgi:PmbA protein